MAAKLVSTRQDVLLRRLTERRPVALSTAFSDVMTIGVLPSGYVLMERCQFDDITDFDRENTWGLFGTDDDTTRGSYDIFRKHYSNASRFDGGHQLNEHALCTAVLPLIKGLLGVPIPLRR